MKFTNVFNAKKNIRALTFISMIFSLSGLVHCAYADATTQAVNNLVGGYGAEQLTGTPTAMDQPGPDDPYYMLIGGVVNAFLNPQVSNGQQQPSPQVALSQSALLMLLTTTNPSLVSSKMLAIPVPLSAPSGTGNTGGLFGTGGGSQQANAGVENVDVNSLIEPVQYSSNSQQGQASQSQTALNFISFALNLAQPLAVLNFASLSSDNLKTALTNADVQSYVLARNSITAVSSVALSNFYFIYNQRIPQSTESLASTFPEIKQTSLYPEASPLAIIHYIGTRALTDPTWHQKLVQQTPPAQLLRLQIEQQAQTNFLLYQLYRLEERNLMTLSTIAGDSGIQKRMLLKQLYDKANTAIESQNQ